MIVQIINEVSEPGAQDHKLCFQWCLYVYDNGVSENGYRFIYRKPNGNLCPVRGQTRLPSIASARRLIDCAVREGWGNNEG